MKTLASLAFAAWLALPALAAGAGGADLNLLVITIDTLRPDRLSCYSPEHLRTPRIDALAAKGVLFERAFAHDPETLPSHTNIFLGMTSLAHGVSENSKSVVAPDFETLAELLKGRGYATGAFVSGFPLDSRFGLDQGFDVYDDHYPAKARPGDAFSERPAGKTVAAALQWLSAQKGKWFCWVHLWDPHDPYAPPEPYATQFKDDPYSGEVAYVDAEIGRLMDALGQAGLEGRTAVVLTGDHGESLGDHGETLSRLFRLQRDALGAPHHRRARGQGRPGQGLRQPRRHLPDRLRSRRPGEAGGAPGRVPVAFPEGPDATGPADLLRGPGGLHQPGLGAPAGSHRERQEVHLVADPGALRHGERLRRGQEPGRRRGPPALSKEAAGGHEARRVVARGAQRPSGDRPGDARAAAQPRLRGLAREPDQVLPRPRGRSQDASSARAEDHRSRPAQERGPARAERPRPRRRHQGEEGFRQGLRPALRDLPVAGPRRRRPPGFQERLRREPRRLRLQLGIRRRAGQAGTIRGGGRGPGEVPEPLRPGRGGLELARRGLREHGRHGEGPRGSRPGPGPGAG